jgi:hypothetical protein
LFKEQNASVEALSIGSLLIFDVIIATLIINKGIPALTCTSPFLNSKLPQVIRIAPDSDVTIRRIENPLLELREDA